MSAIFIDTSAFFALLDADDSGHERVKAAWAEMLRSGALLVTSNYILVETYALMQNRLGIEAVRLFQEDIVPLLEIHWIDPPVHSAATSALLVAGRKQLSLVDCSSFEIMRRAGIRTAFTLDRHFREYGFECVPFVKFAVHEENASYSASVAETSDDLDNSLENATLEGLPKH